MIFFTLSLDFLASLQPFPQPKPAFLHSHSPNQHFFSLVQPWVSLFIRLSSLVVPEKITLKSFQTKVTKPIYLFDSNSRLVTISFVTVKGGNRPARRLAGLCGDQKFASGQTRPGQKFWHNKIYKYIKKFFCTKWWLSVGMGHRAGPLCCWARNIKKNYTEPARPIVLI